MSFATSSADASELTLVDTNILLYAFNEGLPQHRAARTWLLQMLDREREVCFAWITIVAFIRITTSHRAFSGALTVADAMQRLDRILDHPSVKLLQPSNTFWPKYQHLLQTSTAHGNLANDAYLAALALDHNATFATHDQDFLRWQPHGLKLLYPLA